MLKVLDPVLVVLTVLALLLAAMAGGWNVAPSSARAPST